MVKVKDLEENITPVSKVIVPEIRNRSKFSDLLIKYAEEEKVLVKGRFRNFDKPGGLERIKQKKYPQELAPGFDKWMIDGEVYEVPLWVARWLNGIDVTATKLDGKINSCRYPVHEWQTTKSGDVPLGATDDRGIPTPNRTRPAKWERRFAFESMEFDAGLS